MFYLESTITFNTRESAFAILSEAQSVKRHERISGEFGPRLIYTKDRVQPFRRYQPLSEIDAVNGRICTKSGMWYPGSKLVYMGGLPYGFDQVPKERLRWSPLVQ